MPPHHVLAQVEFVVVAERRDRDDILVELRGGSKPLAEVHMTWKKETNPRFPRTSFYDSWQHWALTSMTAANFDFTASGE